MCLHWQWEETNPGDEAASNAWTAAVLQLLRQNTPGPYEGYQNYFDGDLTHEEWSTQVRVQPPPLCGITACGVVSGV